jgi:hypothetical protein
VALAAVALGRYNRCRIASESVSGSRRVEKKAVDEKVDEPEGGGCIRQAVKASCGLRGCGQSILKKKKGIEFVYVLRYLWHDVIGLD